MCVCNQAFPYQYKVDVVKTELARPAETATYKTPNHRVIKEYPSNLGYNCWTYASSKKSLPQGLYTLQDKIKKITSKEPEKGSVGVTREGPQGHLVFIEEVKEKTLIISEGNYIHGKISWREIPRSLVVGIL